MKGLWVSAEKMHEIPFAHEGGELAHATLFPMFDEKGSISSVMVVDRHTSDIWIFRPRIIRIGYRWFRPISIDGELEVVTERIMQAIEPLWHYDPWWLLGATKYKNNPFTLRLMQTNCVEKFTERIDTLVYGSSLKKVWWADRKTKSGTEHHQFRDVFDPQKRPNTRPEHEDTDSGTSTARTEWVIDPFWHAK